MMQRISVWATGLVMLGAASLAAEAAPRDRNYVPPQDDVTVGELGGQRKDAPAAVKGSPKAAIAPVVQPKVESEVRYQDVDSASPGGASTRSPSGQAASSLEAQPRSTVEAVGPNGYYAGSQSAPGATPSLSPTDTFLAQNPFLSGMVAGAFGETIGSYLYGGAMTGDQNGVRIGYGARMGLIVLAVFLVMRRFWKASLKNDSFASEPRAGSRIRREPGFGPRPEARQSGVRREPTL